METNIRLTNVAVLGAAGKMGSGIMLLTTMQLLDMKLSNQGESFSPVIQAIDPNLDTLRGLRKYLETQVLKAAEKKCVWLREVYKSEASLVDNSDFINRYVSDALSIVNFTQRLESAYDSYLVFEAASENPDLKVKLFTQIDQNSQREPWFFTNTSSIPIGYLDERSNLSGRLVGFHFYNPPAIQKLLELIPAKNTLPELATFAEQWAKALKKTVVISNDIAGFIGNGHFMRDLLYAISQRTKASRDFSIPASILMMDKISREYLVRPMGIFQLMDYVGIDVCQYILSVMDKFIPGKNLHSDFIDSLITMGVKGGQFPDGSQKDGIFKYAKGKIIAIWDPEAKQYANADEVIPVVDAWLGKMPEGIQPWKNVMKMTNREDYLKKHFEILRNCSETGAVMALEYNSYSGKVGQALVDDGVAASTKDVNVVLTTGFFHSYGPVHSF